MSSPHWNPQEPHHDAYPTPSGGWGPGEPAPGPAVPPPRPPGWDFPAQEPSAVAEPETAGFGRRLTARAIDYVLAFFAAGAFFLVMVLVTAALTGSTEATDAEGLVWALLFLFGWGLLLFFYDWLYLVTWGRTLGKLLVGIKVVSSADGGKLSQGQAMGRAAIFGLPQSLPCLGNVFALLESMGSLSDERGRALHDRVVGTEVVRV